MFMWSGLLIYNQKNYTVMQIKENIVLQLPTYIITYITWKHKAE